MEPTFDFRVFVLGFSTIMLIITGVKSFLNRWDRAYLSCSLMFTMVFLDCLTRLYQYQLPGSSLILFGATLPIVTFNHLTPFFLILLYREFLGIKKDNLLVYRIINLGLAVIILQVTITLISGYCEWLIPISQQLYRLFLIYSLIIFTIFPFYTLKYWKHSYYIFPAISSWIIWTIYTNFFLITFFPAFREITPTLLSTGNSLFVILLTEGTLFLIALAVKDKIVYTERVEFEKEVNVQKMKALQAQINPHFIFNCLNSIKSLNLAGKIEKANKYLDEFAIFLRQVLNHSSEEAISLHEIIANITRYLDLEKLRLDGKFDYEVLFNEDVDLELIKIPPMLIQPYVENAIWHGISHESIQHGSIKIHFTIVNEVLQVIIRDNGIGINQSQNYKSQEKIHHSIGSKLTKERLLMIAGKIEDQARVSIADRSSSKQPGTEVTLQIPIL